MSEVWSFTKIFQTFRNEKDKLLSDSEYKKNFIGFIEKWLNLKASSPLILKERKDWDDEIAIVVQILNEIGEYEKYNNWYEFWKQIFGRDFSVVFDEKRVFVKWG